MELELYLKQLVINGRSFTAILICYTTNVESNWLLQGRPGTLANMQSSRN